MPLVPLVPPQIADQKVMEITGQGTQGGDFDRCEPFDFAVGSSTLYNGPWPRVYMIGTYTLRVKAVFTESGVAGAGQYLNWYLSPM